MAGLQSGEGHMMIYSVLRAQYINVTDTQTATLPKQMWRQCTGVRQQKSILTHLAIYEVDFSQNTKQILRAKDIIMDTGHAGLMVRWDS